MLKLGIADELIVTIARIVGGRSSITLVEGEGCDQISEGISLKLKDVRSMLTGK